MVGDPVVNEAAEYESGYLSITTPEAPLVPFPSPGLEPP